MSPTKAPTKLKRPEPFEVGPIKVRVVRGPHKEDPRSWYWRAVRYQDGDERTLWTGWASRSEATEIAARMVAEGLIDPDDRPAGPVLDLRRATVADLLDAWKEEQRIRAGLGEDWRPLPGGRASLARNTAINYRNQCKALCAILGRVRLEELSARTIARYREARRAAGRKPIVVHFELCSLRTAWTWGRELGQAPARDFPNLGTCDPTPGEQYTPTPDEVAAVLEHLTGWPRLCAALLEATGARLAEIGALRWGDLDPRKKEAILGRHADARKTGERRVPLPLDLWTALELHRGKAGPAGLILGPDLRGVERQFRRRLIAACKAAEVEVFTAKGYRRLMSRRLMRAGTDPKAYEEIMGHGFNVGLRWYRIEVGAEDRRAALERAGIGERPAGQVIKGPWKASG